MEGGRRDESWRFETPGVDEPERPRVARAYSFVGEWVPRTDSVDVNLITFVLLANPQVPVNDLFRVGRASDPGRSWSSAGLRYLAMHWVEDALRRYSVAMLAAGRSVDRSDPVAMRNALDDFMGGWSLLVSRPPGVGIGAESVAQGPVEPSRSAESSVGLGDHVIFEDSPDSPDSVGYAEVADQPSSGDVRSLDAEELSEGTASSTEDWFDSLTESHFA